jgi:hypothetical protein
MLRMTAWEEARQMLGGMVICIQSMKAFVVTFLSALLLPLPIQAEPQIVPDPFPPAHFTGLYIEKSDGATDIAIRLTGDEIVYTATVGGQLSEKLTNRPSGDDWFQFIQALNDAKVYKWAPKYEYPGQGVSWAIVLTMDDRKFSSEGVNEYPKEGAEAEPVADPKAGPSIPFQLFWQAAVKLAGKPPAPAPAK